MEKMVHAHEILLKINFLSVLKYNYYIRRHTSHSAQGTQIRDMHKKTLFPFMA